MPFTETQMKQVFGTNLMDFAVSHGFEVQKGGSMAEQGLRSVVAGKGIFRGATGRQEAPCLQKKTDKTMLCIRKLQVVQLFIKPRLQQQLLVGAGFMDLSVVHDDDLIRVLDRGEPVGDHDRGAAGHQALERFRDHALGLRVDVRGRLIQNENRGIIG